MHEPWKKKKLIKKEDIAMFKLEFWENYEKEGYHIILRITSPSGKEIMKFRLQNFASAKEVEYIQIQFEQLLKNIEFQETQPTDKHTKLIYRTAGFVLIYLIGIVILAAI